MTDKPEKRCPSSLVIKKVRVNALMRHHLTSARVTTIKQFTTPNVGKLVEQLGFSYTAGKNTNEITTWKMVWPCLIKLSMQPSYDMLGIYFRKNETIFP